MKIPPIDRSRFTFRHLPALANWIRANRLEEYGRRSLAMSRESALPMLRPFLKLSDEELLDMGRENNRKYLEALAADIVPYVEQSLRNWLENNLGIISREDIHAEDITMAFSIRRRLLNSFARDFTSDDQVLAALAGEIETYTSSEEILCWSVYMNIQQQMLRESETLHKEVQALTHLGHWSWDFVTQKLYWSDELFRIFELPVASENLNIDVFLNHLHADDREKMQAYLGGLQRGRFAEEIEYRIVGARGTVKNLRTISKAGFDASGKVLRAYGTCQDITREYALNAELRQANQSLMEMNRDLRNVNEELQSFNYVASHDLQEPLRKILVYGNRLMENSSGLNEEAKDAINRMLNASTRMQNLITDLIEFSQVSEGNDNHEKVDLNLIIAEVWSSLRDTVDETSATLNLAPLPLVRASGFQMTQLFTNLISNALKYRSASRPPVITISCRESGGADAENPDKVFLGIEVRDNGIGFDPAHRHSIFELFKRLHTREQYPGTGIGLSICKKIANRHDGFMTADSSPGNGSVFTVFLPLERLVSR